jgi:hypothetical protein
MLHISKLNYLTEKKDSKGNPVPFSFCAISSKGEILRGDNCIVTSSNFKNSTRNIKYLDSGEIIKLRNYSFIEINGIEITL